MARFEIPPIYKPKIYLNMLNKLKFINNKKTVESEKVKKKNTSYFVQKNFGRRNFGSGPVLNSDIYNKEFYENKFMDLDDKAEKKIIQEYFLAN